MVLAARVGTILYITIGKGAVLATRSTVIRDVPAGGHRAAPPTPSRSRQFP
jgi:acetyltransferase-like isoleucine patch superfamily enzyme